MLNLEIGQTIQLQYSNDEKYSIEVELVGFKDNQYLILAYKNKVLLNYQKRQQIKLKFFSDHTIFYHSTIIDILEHPVKLLFVKYPLGLNSKPSKKPLPKIVPKSHSLQERIGRLSRKNDRVDSLIPIVRPGGDTGQECIVNISKTGALLQLNKKMRIKEDFVISFELATGEKITNLNCQVIRVEMTGTRTLVAIKFDTDHPQHIFIEKYVTSCLARLGQESLSNTEYKWNQP